jgi:bacterioferritin-associated ferredoxin
MIGSRNNLKFDWFEICVTGGLGQDSAEPYPVRDTAIRHEKFSAAIAVGAGCGNCALQMNQMALAADSCTPRGYPICAMTSRVRGFRPQSGSKVG